MSPSQIPPFSDLHFGRRDAHDEAANEPALLLQGYYDYEGAASALEAREAYLLLGPKGAGKSAVLEHLRLKFESEPTKFLHLWDLRSFPVAEVRNVKLGPNAGLARTQSSWEFLLLLRLLDALPSDQGYSDTRRVGALRKALTSEGLLQGDWRTAVTSLTKATVKLPLPIGPELGGEFERRKIELLQLTGVLTTELCASEVATDHFIALDGLDSLLFEGENQWESLSGLVQAMEALNREFTRNNKRVHFIAALRSDIYNILPSAESNKYKALAVEFHWASGGATSSNRLWDLIDGKVRVGHPDHESIVEQYLTSSVAVGQGTPAPDYILEFTRYLPRDIIELLKHIAAHSTKPGPPHSAAIMDGTKDYCDKYFEGEVFNNLFGVLDRNDHAARKTAAFRDALRTLPTRTFTFDEVMSEVEGTLSREEVTDLLRKMFETGAIGIYNDTVRPAHTDFVFRKPGGSGFTKRYKFVLHNALARAYNRPSRKPRQKPASSKSAAPSKSKAPKTNSQSRRREPARKSGDERQPSRTRRERQRTRGGKPTTE